MTYTVWGFGATMLGTILLSATECFESGGRYFEQDLWLYATVHKTLYWLGLVMLLVGFGLQLWEAWGRSRAR
jgi:hypothetical protein